jgi:hypothetical protein
MRRIALCLYALALVLPMVGCGDDAADTTTPANTTTTPAETPADPAAPAEGG